MALLEMHTIKYLKFCIKISSASVLIDLSKAFDAVDHEILAKMLAHHGAVLLSSQIALKIKSNLICTLVRLRTN